MATAAAFNTQSSVIHRLSSALLPSQSPDITLHTCNTHFPRLSLFLPHTYTQTRYFDNVPPAPRVSGTETHTVSPQRSLINEMVCSLPQAWTNQAQRHKSLPAGDAEGHRPLFIGNLSPNYPDRDSNTLTTGRHQHHVCLGVCVFHVHLVNLSQGNKYSC